MSASHIFSEIFFAFCDIIFIYFMTNNLCGSKATIAFKKIKIIPAIIIFTFTSVFYVVGQVVLPLTLYGLLASIFILVLTWVFSEQKRIISSLDEIILIWLFSYAFLYLLLVPFLLIASVFIENETIIMSVVYAISTIITVGFVQKLDFNKLLMLTLRTTVFKIAIFLMAILFFLIPATTAEIDDILNHNLLTFPSIIPVLIVLIGLIHTIKITHQNTTIAPEAYHDAKKLLMLLDIQAEKATNVDELKDMLAESIDLMNLKLPYPNPTASNIESINFEKFIRQTIESVKIDKKSNATIISNIQFSDRYYEVNDIKIAYMTGLLLEHALGTFTKRPIYVDITSSKEGASIRISCEYIVEKSLKNFEMFLLDNEVMRSKNKKRFNLSKLRSIVVSHNGSSAITREKNIQEHVDYLSIYLVFKKEGGSLE